MLGGSVYIAFIRLIFNLAGTILIFSLLSESRFSRKKTIVCYGCYGMVLAVLACIWYMADWESYARMAALVIYICFAVFAVFMSRDSLYLAVYKLALTFYLMAVFVVGGLEISILFFERNVWADIIVRILLSALIEFLLNTYVKDTIKDFACL